DEFARHRHRALLPQRLLHLKGLAAAVFAGLDAVGDAADAVLHQRAIDETRPDVQDVDQFARELAKAPGLVGVNNARVVVVAQPIVEIDHAADERRREDADAAVVQEIDAGWLALL